jgi:hypothetical protein
LITKERKGENAKEGRVTRRASGFAIALIPLRLIVFGERDGQCRTERWRGIFTQLVLPPSSFFGLSLLRVFAILCFPFSPFPFFRLTLK